MGKVRNDSMMKRTIFAVAVAGFCAAFFQIMNAQAFWGWSLSPSTPVVYSDGTRYDAFNVAVRLSNGNILEFYRNGTTHASDRGVIVLRTSTDGGSTWTLFSGTNYCSGDVSGCLFADTSANQFDSRNAAGGLSVDGATIVILWQQYNQTAGTVAGVPSGGSNGVFVSRSTDNGITWSTPAAISGEYWSYGGLVVVPSTLNWTGSCASSCIAASFGANQTNSGATIKLVYSYDNGGTWDTAHAKTLTGLSTDEVTLIPTKVADQLIGVDRPNTNNNLIFTTSNDQGTTWTATVTNIVPASTPSGCTVGSNGQVDVSPILFDPSLADGSVLLVVAERDDWNVPCGPYSGIGKIFYLRSLFFKPADAISNPTAFQKLQTIATPLRVTGFVNFGYPSVVQTSVLNLFIQYNAQVNFSDVNGVSMYGFNAAISVPIAGSTSLIAHEQGAVIKPQ